MKIIKTKKYANTFEGYDPYKVDFTSESEKAKQMETESLFGALKDAIEASQVSVNEGKYYDQASVYRAELKNRGFSFDKQDEKLKGMSSLHTNPQMVDNLKCSICGNVKNWEEFTPNEVGPDICKECTEVEQEEQRAGQHFMDSGESQNYPEFGEI